MATVKYLDYTGLQQYDELVKKFIKAEDKKITDYIGQIPLDEEGHPVAADVIEYIAQQVAGAGALTYKGTTTTVPADPTDGDLYYFNIAATETEEANIGWKFWSKTDAAWKALNDATLSTRVEELEAVVGNADNTLNAYESKETLIEILNLLTNASANEQGSILNLIRENAKDGTYKKETGYLISGGGPADGMILTKAQKDELEAKGTLTLTSGDANNRFKDFVITKNSDNEKYTITDSEGSQLTNYADFDTEVQINKTIAQAIDEIATSGGAVIINTATTSKDALKTYTFIQYDKEIGKIDIPKDFLVKSGEVCWFVAATGEGATGYVKMPAGTPVAELPENVVVDTKYLALTINVKADTTEDPVEDQIVYIAVNDLVDAYTVEENAKEIQLAISDANVISAVIVDASIARDKIDEDFEADLTAIENAIGKHTVTTDEGEVEVLYPVTDRIEAEAKDGIYKPEDTEKGTAAITIAEAIAALEEASSDTNGALVYKEDVTELPKVAKVGDAYVITSTKTLYVCTAANTETTDAVFKPLAVNGAFTLGEDDLAHDVDIKTYIDSRIFVGPQADYDAALADGSIDKSTFAVITDAEADVIAPIDAEDIEELFKEEP